MRLVVGCPVYERAWVLGHWFDHLATFLDGHDVIFAFIYTPSHDGTYEILKQRGTEIGNAVLISQYTDGTHSTERDWNRAERIETLAALRNRLLEVVRQLDFDAFLSLDSDILMPDHGMDQLIGGFGRYDAVSPLVYLTEYGVSAPNAFYAGRVNRRVKVYKALQVADILCAAVLMTRELVDDRRVSYGFHPQGEDLYWSEQARKRGFTLGIDTSIVAKHVMKPEMLDREDWRVGW